MDGTDGHGEPIQDRRSFLGQLGKTVAVGLGLGLLTGSSASGRTDACAIYCYQACGYSCSAGACPGQPACSGNCFHCVSGCGYDYYECQAHACSSYCFSPNAC
jgi:hypothetical protein